MKKKIIKDGIFSRGTNTLIRDWRLSVGSKILQLDVPTSDGNIEKIPPFPDTIPFKGREELGFQWRTGYKYYSEINKEDFKAKFYVTLNAKYKSAIPTLIALLALLLTVIPIFKIIIPLLITRITHLINKIPIR